MMLKPAYSLNWWEELSLFLALFHELFSAGLEQMFWLTAFEQAHSLFLSSWKSEWWKEWIWLQTFIYQSIYEMKLKRHEKTSPLCFLLFTKLSKEGASDLMILSSEMTANLQSLFFPSISNWFNSLVSVSNSLPLSLFVSVCSYWNFPVILIPCGVWLLRTESMFLWMCMKKKNVWRGLDRNNTETVWKAKIRRTTRSHIL